MNQVVDRIRGRQMCRTLNDRSWLSARYQAVEFDLTSAHNNIQGSFRNGQILSGDHHGPVNPSSAAGTVITRDDYKNPNNDSGHSSRCRFPPLRLFHGAAAGAQGTGLEQHYRRPY